MSMQRDLDRANEFQMSGFLHVTGLPVRDEEYRVRLPEIDRAWFGHWSVRDGRLIIVTSDGEIWIAPQGVIKKGVHLRFCPKGQADFDFHESKEGIFIWHIVQRRKDPYANCDPDPLASWTPGFPGEDIFSAA